MSTMAGAIGSADGSSRVFSGDNEDGKEYKRWKVWVTNKLLRPTGELTVGNTISFLGRNICNQGDYYEISLADHYTTELLEEANMLNCNPAPAPGNNTLKATSEMEQELNKEEHAAYRRMVGKLQWMTYTRPDIGFATKETRKSIDTANFLP